MLSEDLAPGPWEIIHHELGVTVPDEGAIPLSVHVARHAHSIPDNIALTYFDRNISYRELDKHANKMANALIALGVEYGDLVGIYMPNCPQFVIALLAASKLGATVSGISAVLSPVELGRQIKDANIKVLLSLDSMAIAAFGKLDVIPSCLTDIILSNANDFLQPTSFELPSFKGIATHAYLALTESASAIIQQVDLPPDHILLIQYTGGTTGPSKGAKLTLGGTMLNAALTQVYEPWIEGNEIVASALPMFHVAGMIKLTISLRYGAQFLLIPNPRDIEHFCQQMLKYPPTRIGAVPTLYQQIADHPLSLHIDFFNLKFAMTGSAPITGAARVRIEKLLNGIILSDSFGMTETGPAIIANPPKRCKADALGLPLPGIDVRIVDVETGTNELPYGEAGEIIASTPCIMAGYLNRPEETANALREWRGKIWMHTGDVGVMDEDGYVYIRDRTKDMIIVSGFKVFSTEVENELSVLESIALSALIGCPDPKRPGSEIVNLYVQLTPEARQRDHEEIQKDILDFCNANLARYKIPKVIHILEELPLTGVGKVDKKALRRS